MAIDLPILLRAYATGLFPMADDRAAPSIFWVQPETRAILRSSDSPFDFDDLRYVEDVEASKAVTARSEPAIVISGSGMCEAGRILHHLRSSIEDEKATMPPV